jgi:DNA primase small subunit
MEARTRAYLRGRFGDHYRRTTIDPPPAANEREWGYVPWTEGPGETMVRHRALIDLGDLEGFLARERPKHTYFSAGCYDDPAAGSMSEKGWRHSDLIFDLDADHLPWVDPTADAYAEMLAACKDALQRLLSFLERDFGFEDLTVVFSGGRGYHVHVRDPGVQQLERDARREIVDYVRGIGLESDALIDTRMRGNATARVLQTEGGWGRRVHERLLSVVDELDAREEDAARDLLTDLDEIGDKRAATILGAVRANRSALEAGNVEAGGPGTRTLVESLVHETVAEQNAPIDEPVTTDTNRLIRLPGSLHGGSGLAVRRVPREEVSAFDPLTDAIPETFRGHEIAIELDEPVSGRLDGDSFTLDGGHLTVPEYLGVFLMARGDAEKGEE